MIQKYILFIFLFLQFSVFAQEKPEPKLIAEVEGLAHPESIVYDETRDNLYVSVMADKEEGDGSIAIVSPEGQIKNAEFVTGLNNPKGIALYENKLYVSDVTFLYEIDLDSGKILNKYTGENARSLNDVALDQEGNVYVSDMGNSSIYKLDSEGNFKEWLSTSELQTPNGLLFDEADLYIAGWASDATKDSENPMGGFMKIANSSDTIEKLTEELGNLDGIQKYDDDSFLVSDWNSGNIYRISKAGEVKPILKVEKSVGDILYVPQKNMLALPMNFQNKLMIYSYE
tara:strand:+ start:1021 stop:1878 length:858 start_codon:yes stop_codon:yes gene_type:complete